MGAYSEGLTGRLSYLMCMSTVRGRSKVVRFDEFPAIIIVSVLWIEMKMQREASEGRIIKYQLRTSNTAARLLWRPSPVFTSGPQHVMSRAKLWNCNTMPTAPLLNQFLRLQAREAAQSLASDFHNLSVCKGVMQTSLGLTRSKSKQWRKKKRRIVPWWFARRTRRKQPQETIARIRVHLTSIGR